MHALRNLLLGLMLASCSDDVDSPEAPEEAGDPPPAARTDARVALVRDAAAPSIDAHRMRPPQCDAGRYEGEFSCVISGLLPWVGKISFDLVEESTRNGEFQTLSIVPGTRIMGSDDSLSGMFTADLEGSFDCGTGKLDGRIANGVYLFAGFMEYELEGPLDGSYRGDGGAPGFDGMIALTSPTFEALGELGPSATCTWSAARIARIAEDAGR